MFDACRDLKGQIAFVPARLLVRSRFWNCEGRVLGGAGVDRVGLGLVKAGPNAGEGG